MPGKWCTVTVKDVDGQRRSLDIEAASTYDAAHLYLHQLRSHPEWPKPTRLTVFEVVTGGKVYRVGGSRLQRWIVERRQELKGPKGMLFRERPTLE